MTDVVAINRARRMALTDDDAVLRLEILLDEDGDETDDIDDALVAIAQHPNGKWWAIDLTAFEEQQVH